MQVAAQASGKVRPAAMLSAETIDEARRLDDGVRREIGDDAVVLDVEMAAIGATRLERLDDVAGVLVGARGDIDRLLRLLEKDREVGLEPIARFDAIAEIAAGLAVDPVGHVDPATDLLRPLAIPRQIFGQVAVALGRIDAEPLQDVDPNLLLPGIDGMALEGGEQFVAADRSSAQAHVDVPGLMVDAAADVFDLVRVSAPSASAICRQPCCTPWQSPIVSTLPWSIAAQVFIAIGLA